MNKRDSIREAARRYGIRIQKSDTDTLKSVLLALFPRRTASARQRRTLRQYRAAMRSL